MCTSLSLWFAVRPFKHLTRPRLDLAAAGSGSGRRGRTRSRFGQCLNRAVEPQNIHEAGVGRHDIFCVLRESIVQDFEAAHGFSALLEIGFATFGDQFVASAFPLAPSVPPLA